MRILAIDPGPEQSAYVIYDSETEIVTSSGILDNESFLKSLWFDGAKWEVNRVAIEMIASYGMAVGREVFETVFWIGRFFETATYFWPPVQRIYRKDVKLHLCNSPRAKDANVRQALIDLFGKTRTEAVGTKKQPGPLYGIKKDMWQALAVAVTAAETR